MEVVMAAADDEMRMGRRWRIYATETAAVSSDPIESESVSADPATAAAGGNVRSAIDAEKPSPAEFMFDCM